MTSSKKFVIISILIILLSFVFVRPSLAAGRELEVPIPGLLVTTLPALPDYIDAIYKFALSIIGIICLGALIYGGFRYLTSAGSPSTMNDAKDQIFSALLGLIILFSAWLILNTINPELVILGEPTKTPIGGMPGSGDSLITFYENDEYTGNSLKVKQSIPDLSTTSWDTVAVNADNKISSIKIEDPRYAAVVFEYPKFEGKAQLIESSISGLDNYLNNYISSIYLIKKADTFEKVTLYDSINYNSPPPVPPPPGYFSDPVDFYYSYPNFVGIKNGTGLSFNDLASSIEVGKRAIVILYEDIDYKGAATIITKSVPNLADIACPTPTCCWQGANWNNIASSIQIVGGVTDLYGTCSDNDSTNQATCEGAGCKWCSKCSGYKGNTWQQNKCVEYGTDCGYNCSTDCGANPNACHGGCERFDWNTCGCVPTSCCLKEGSLVLTPSGFKRIEDLTEGDYVIGYKDSERVKSKILKKSEHAGEFELYFYKGYWFTGNHLVYLEDYKEFKPASELSNITKYYKGKVYNIQTETHNYFGENDLLIHNK